MSVIEKGKFNGRRIYQRRVELGYTLKQVGVLTGRSIGAVHGWESGDLDPTARSIYLLSLALRVKPAYFFNQ